MIKLLLAIMVVESGTDSTKVGDNGQALGAYQIHQEYWKDACSFGGVDWPYSDATDVYKSTKVVLWYWQRYCPEAYKNWDFETLARVHNGGPRGHLKESTVQYWKLVKGILDE